MAARGGSKKGKAVDMSTAWSEWNFDDRGFWVSSRCNPAGELEYSYRYDTQQAQITSNPAAVPRTTNPNDPNDSNDTGQPFHEHVSTSGSSYTHRSTSDATESGVPGHQDYYGHTQPVEFPRSSSSSAPHYSSHQDVSHDYNPPPRSAFFPSSNANSYSPKDAATLLQAMNIGSSSFTSTYVPQENTSSHPPIDVALEPPEGDPSLLASNYKIISTRDEKNFWRVGRVFLALWTEPARDSHQIAPGASIASQVAVTYLGSKSFSEIRRFVVVQARHGSATCCAIQTYGGQATLKPNLPYVEEHAIIYTGSQPPGQHSQMRNGIMVYEDLCKDPIKVKREGSGPECRLHNLSRINYGKVYTVEHYTKVLNIGMVDTNSMHTLHENSPVKSSKASEKSKSHSSRPKQEHKRRGNDSRKDNHEPARPESSKGKSRR